MEPSRPAARRALAPGRAWAAAVAALVMATGASAGTELSFGQAFEAALAHDPVYRAAAHARDATLQEEPIARAALMPVVTLNAATAQVEGTRSFPNALNQDVRTQLDYQSPQAALSVRMPLVNFEGIAGLAQAQARGQGAVEQFRVDGLDLLDRLSDAYLQLIAAQETAALIGRQVVTLDTRLSQARERFSQGEGTRVQLAQAQAALEVGRSRAIEADNQLAVARQTMTRLTGVSDPGVPGLPAAVGLAPLDPGSLQEWLNLAHRNSPTLRVREKFLEVAQAAVRRRQAGHMPRLDAVGTISRQESDSISSIGQRTTLRSLGLQLSVPLFSGGGVDASVRQAKALQMQAEEELRLEREMLILDLTRLWQTMGSGEARIQGLVETLTSSRLALRGAERALQEGVGTAAEVADVQSAVLEIERQLLQARVDHLRNRVRLQVRAGLLTSDVVEDMDRMWRPVVAASETGGRP